jgi:hypothetical protein
LSCADGGRRRHVDRRRGGPVPGDRLELFGHEPGVR